MRSMVRQAHFACKSSRVTTPNCPQVVNSNTKIPEFEGLLSRRTGAAAAARSGAPGPDLESKDRRVIRNARRWSALPPAGLKFRARTRLAHRPHEVARNPVARWQRRRCPGRKTLLRDEQGEAVGSIRLHRRDRMAADARGLGQGNAGVLTLDHRIAEQIGTAIAIEKIGLHAIESIVLPLGSEVRLGHQRGKSGRQAGIRAVGGRGNGAKRIVASKRLATFRIGERVLRLKGCPNPVGSELRDEMHSSQGQASASDLFDVNALGEIVAALELYPVRLDLNRRRRGLDVGARLCRCGLPGAIPEANP